MPSPIWITKAGSLGVIPDEEFYQFLFEVYETSQTPQPVSGKLSFDANRPSDISGRVDSRTVFGIETSFTTELEVGDRLINDYGVVLGIVDEIIGNGELRLTQNATFTASNITVRSLDNMTFKLISGSLPPGLRIDQFGNMSGVPINGVLEGVPAAVQVVTTSTFTVRATNRFGEISDRTFSITVAGVDSISLEPKDSLLGIVFDGDYFSYVIRAYTPKSNSVVTWKTNEFSLPPGLTLTPVTLDDNGEVITDGSPGMPGGLLQGYINPSSISASEASKTYTFTVTASDGATVDISNYSIRIYNRNLCTADSDIIRSDLNLIDVDTANVYTPVLYNSDTVMDLARQGNYYMYHFNGEDFNGDQIKYSISTTSVDQLPPGLTLNENTGWVTGVVAYGAVDTVNYQLTIRVGKADPALSNYYIEKKFVLPVVSQFAKATNWYTDSDLGEIENGSISTLSVMAHASDDRPLQYQLVSGELPHGLSLSNNGLIIGRASFEAFMLDSGRTTFDDKTTVDQVFHFTVKAYSSDLLVIDYKDFRVRVTAVNSKPYENLYIRALPTQEQRYTYNQIINNTDIFPRSSIYRDSDPWFGRNLNLRSLFLSGLTSVEATEYARVMNKNHYRKTLTYGDVKTAQALDKNFNVLYEVVYVDLIETDTNEQGQSAPIDITLPKNSVGRDKDGIQVSPLLTDIYPNSFNNMRDRITQDPEIGYENKAILPGWMTSRQADGRVLGFTRALVLCYTNPGKSSEIAYRVNQVIDDLRLVGFTIDRYEWDHYLSSNYDKETGSFNPGVFTEFSDSVDTGMTYLKYPEVPISTNLTAGS